MIILTGEYDLKRVELHEIVNDILLAAQAVLEIGQVANLVPDQLNPEDSLLKILKLQKDAAYE